MNLAEFAAAVTDIAERAEASLARDACAEGAKDYLAIMRIVTPKLTGALADSETVTGPEGSGTYALALVGPHIIYDRFRNDGGTIRVKRAKVLTDGRAFFGKEVHQEGAHYMEKAAAEGRGPFSAAVAQVAGEFISL